MAALAILATLVGCGQTAELTVTMADSSMEPTFSAWTQLRFLSASRADRGEVIAFEYPFPYPGRPRRELISRVIGLPDDDLQLGPTGLLINGQPYVEPYAIHQDAVSPQRLTVPPGTYFVLGDDRANQRDSRWWGLLPAQRVLGVWTGR
jgi:signal peptidase I